MRLIDIRGFNDELEIEEHDHIIIEQLHVAYRIKRKLKRAKKIMKDDPLVDAFIESNKKRIDFFECMIDDKSLLSKKHKKKKKKPKDVLAKESIKDWYRFYRDFVFHTIFNYKIVKDYVSEYYVTLFRK
jgi:hypothetical protein